MAGATIRGEYPPDWPEIAARVKREADGCCVRCGHRHDPEAGRTLTVHHLDGDKGNSAWWNLLALDQACHLSIQGRVNVAQAYLHPHTPWFRPYAAGYYASAILGVKLTRAEVEADLEALLLVGQPWLDRSPEVQARLDAILDWCARERHPNRWSIS